MCMSLKSEPDLGRLSVARLRARRRAVARLFPDVAAFLAGSLQSQRRRCGKPGCRCERGELHGPYLYLALRAGGRTRMLYVPAELARQVRRGLARSERVRAALDELSAINLELLARGELD